MSARASVSCRALVDALDRLDARDATARPFDASTLSGLVADAVAAARPVCPVPAALAALAGRVGATHALARIELLRDRPADALAAATRTRTSAAVWRRRGDLLVELARTDDAIRALRASLAIEDDDDTRARVATLWLASNRPADALAVVGDRSAPALTQIRVAALVGLGRYAEASAVIAAAPIHERADLSTAAVAAALAPAALAVAEAPAELLVAVARDGEPAAACALYARAAELAPRDADIHMAHAEALEAAGRGLDAVAAWDRAAALAPASERAVLAPVRILAAAGDVSSARGRAVALAGGAADADALRIAAWAAHYAGDARGAVDLARRAVGANPDDGRLQSELADRLADAGQIGDARAVRARLFVCGARGVPWHRHEVARRLADSGDAAAVRAAVEAVDCAAVDADDLAFHLRAVLR